MSMGDLPSIFRPDNAADNRIDDESGRIIHASGMANFGFFLGLDVIPLNGDGTAEEPLVNDA